ncbi:ACP phosphodiesterase [Neptunicella sp. SCSIO 80796]|uniref:acyl carrier protein phosphodiesterase n=1 Tax=Neptunicella plasticusilytica TaxID=3117012 RepID=UPI003A4DB2D4
MNYLAHLFLAQPNPDSHTGNLLGDFCRGIDTTVFSDRILAGLRNHRMVDKYTDTHPVIRQAKQQFRHSQRRFAGIALDVLFDHYLIVHWSEYSQTDFDQFCQQAYAKLAQRLAIMPPRMQQVIGSMVEHQWLSQYQSLDGVARALDAIAKRIRFTNQFAGSIKDIEQNYIEFEQCFNQFFPTLIQHVDQYGPE